MGTETLFPPDIQNQQVPHQPSLKNIAKRVPYLIPLPFLANFPNYLDVAVTTLPRVELGRLDDEFVPTLRVMIYEKSGLPKPTLTQEPDNPTKSSNYNWGRTINSWRQKAIEEGLLSPHDKALALLIAHESGNGVHLIDYLQIPEIQRKGLGSSFLTNLASALQEEGFLYWWGEHNPDNIDFFVRKLGSYPLTDLSRESYEAYLKGIPTYLISPLNAVKFTDQHLEEKVVKDRLKATLT